MGFKLEIAGEQHEISEDTLNVLDQVYRKEVRQMRLERKELALEDTIIKEIRVIESHIHNIESDFAGMEDSSASRKKNLLKDISERHQFVQTILAKLQAALGAQRTLGEQRLLPGELRIDERDVHILRKHVDEIGRKILRYQMATRDNDYILAA